MDVTVKLLIVTFSLAVGSCFALWPGEVRRRFARWRGDDTGPTEDGGPHTRWHRLADVLTIRHVGVSLIALTGYVIYLWVRPE